MLLGKLITAELRAHLAMQCIATVCCSCQCLCVVTLPEPKAVLLLMSLYCGIAQAMVLLLTHSSPECNCIWGLGGG